MTALISAELLRLRTVRGPRWTVLGMIAFCAVVAALDSGLPSAGERADSLRAIALNGVIVAAVLAADALGADFRRGGVALTYLRHPGRTRVAVAHMLAHAGVGGLVVALVAATTAAVGLTVAELRDVPVDLDVPDLARLVAGGAFGGAVCTAAAVLIGALTRSPTAAVAAAVGWLMAGSVLDAAGLDVGAYLPFGLVTALGGLGGGVSASAAVLLLLAHLSLLAVAVHRWALPRDLT